MEPLAFSSYKLYDLVPPEIQKEGYEKLIACYKNSLERMRVIYKQDVIRVNLEAYEEEMF